MPAVSVIVPVYKVEKYIHRCVDSILAQTFTDFELILVDDGSPDRCPEICDLYALNDARVRVLHLQNGGVSKARNAGLDIAKGTYISFCDSDDYLAKDFLETLNGTIQKKKADIVIAQYTAVDDNETILWVKKYPHGYTRIRNEEERFKYIVEAVLCGKTGWETCKNMYLSSIIKTNKIRFPTTCNNYAEDACFLLNYCLYVNEIYSVDYSGYFYFIRENSMVRNNLSIAKIDEKNEVSRYFFNHFSRRIKKANLIEQYPVIHYLLLCGEYEKLFEEKRWSDLPKAIENVRNQEWYLSQTRGIKENKKYLNSTFGKKATAQILLISSFCVHKSWVRYRLESAFYNRIIAPLYER